MIEYENLSKSNRKFYLEYLNKIKKILSKGSFILSEEVKNFEKNFSLFCGTKHCTGVGNGLNALTISLESLGLPKKSEIIVASNVYYASILSIIRSGHIPILVEPDIKTYNIDVNKIQNKISKKTKAIMAVHMYGKSCDMDDIIKMCKKNNLFLIEDCAQSHGAKFKNKTTGSFGDFGCFSFYPTKNLGCLGDGGAIVTNNKTLEQKTKLFRNYGSIKRYENDIIGDNSRLDEIQAGFLNVKIRYLNEINNHKRELAKIYFEKVNSNFIKPDIHINYHDVYYVFSLRIDEREKFRKFLLKKGIRTDIHYPNPPYKQKALKSIFLRQKYPISDEIHNTTISLPISYFHSKKNIETICKTINKF